MTVLNSIKSQYWGKKNHESVEDIHLKTWQEVVGGSPSCILMGELETVVTMGVRGHRDEIFDLELPVAQTDRGGATTLHSPGQLIIYPILSLRKLSFSPKELTEYLLKVTVQTFLECGVKSYARMDQVGVWTAVGKIGFCGLRIQNKTVRYGLSLNISNDLSLFNKIKSCGLKEVSYDSLKNHGFTGTPEDISQLWLKNFEKG